MSRSPTNLQEQDRLRRGLSSGSAQVLPWVLAAIVVLLLLGAWRWTPLSEYAQPEQLKEWIDDYLIMPWGPVILIFAYCVANLTLFPNMVLNLAVILALGPWMGVPVSLAGSLVVGIVAFVLGEKFGGKSLDRVQNDKILNGLDMVKRSGLPGMILLRMLPIAPYPIVNVALGAGRVDLKTFVLGTAIGIFPSLVAMGALGLSFDVIWNDPMGKGLVLIVTIVGTYSLLLYWLRRTLRSRVGEAGRKVTSDC